MIETIEFVLGTANGAEEGINCIQNEMSLIDS
jgi:hypothetical protein